MPEKLRISYRPVGTILPDARNARTHSEEQVTQIAGSIGEFGFTNPILVDESSGIIAGHGRALAAEKLGLAKVPCIELKGLSEAQRWGVVSISGSSEPRAAPNENLQFICTFLHERDIEMGTRGPNARPTSPEYRRLSRLERAVAALMEEGLSAAELAERLGVTVRAIKYVRRQIIEAGLFRVIDEGRGRGRRPVYERV